MDNVLFLVEIKAHLKIWNMGPEPKHLNSQALVNISDLFNAEEELPTNLWNLTGSEIQLI